MRPAPPRVSVLIPNFNNGRDSSHDGRVDLIGDLLQSLHDTLIDDPTPLEIIAYDDGSTDDSLDTLRRWAGRTWRGGRPFLQLIEREHCGVLARTSNVLFRRARGDFLVRLDGDTTMLTPRWAALLCEAFDTGPTRLGVIGPKQLNPQGVIHAFGDFVLHPKGYHHVAAGLPRNAVNRAVEVDHVMGCFYCVRRKVFDDLGGFDEDILRGQTIDFGLRARLKGYQCFAIPQIEFVHRHGLRKARDTEADTQSGLLKTLETFEQKWGFNRLAPDLDEVRTRYAGTDLLWNAQVFGALDHAAAPPQTPEQSPWGVYTRDARFKQRTDWCASAAINLIKQVGDATDVALLGGQCGLIPHLLAMHGRDTTAIEDSGQHLRLIEQITASQDYPGAGPTFVNRGGGRRLPMQEATADLLLLIDAMQTDPNPVALLREAWRVVRPNQFLAVIADRASADASRITDPAGGYHWSQLAQLLQSTGRWQVISKPPAQAADQPLVIVARRVADAESQTQSRPRRAAA